jgi:hypothetical protein
MPSVKKTRAGDRMPSHLAATYAIAMAATSDALSPRAAQARRGLLGWLRARGWRRLLYGTLRWLICSRFGRKWLRFAVAEVYHAPVAGLKRSARIPQAFAVRQAAAADAAALGAFFAKPAEVAARFLRGDACYVCEVGGQIAAAVWVAAGPKHYHEDWDEMRCVARVPRGAGFSFDGKGTRPGAWGALMARLPDFLAAAGLGELYTMIGYNNDLSKQSHLSLGYRRIGWVACGGLTWLVLRLGKPSAGRWRRLPRRIGRLAVLHRLPRP